MMITQSNLDALRTGFSTVFNTAYAKALSPELMWWSELSREVPGVSRTNTYGWLAAQLKMKQWKGKRVVKNLSERTKIVTPLPYEETVSVLEEDIEDDNLGVYQGEMIPQLAMAVRKHPNQLLKDLIQSNPTAFDGKALFADDHPTYDEAGDTYDNNFTLALTAENLFTNWSLMTQFKGEDGEPLGIVPRKLFVPPQLWKVAKEICQSDIITQAVKNVAGAENVAAAGSSNVLKGLVQPIMVPQFGNQATTWYLADTDGLMPFLYLVRRQPRFVQRTNVMDPSVFDERKFLFGVDYRCAMTETLPFLISKSVG
jgi:phage major head subunit gpT-like protein